MEFKNIKKNLADYLILFLLIISFYLYLIETRQGLIVYYVIIFFVFISLKFSQGGFIKLCSLSLGAERKKKAIIFVLNIGAAMIISIFLLYIIQSRFLNDFYTRKNYFDYNYAYLFFVFSSVRVFGEELIFRGFLLIKGIQKNNKLFWMLNLIQAFLFSYIHSIFIEELISKLIFTAYVFLISFFMGWINKKYNSLLPSWLIHWGNGILNFFFVF